MRPSQLAWQISGDGSRGRAHVHERALITGGALCRRFAFERREQLEQVVFVARAFAGIARGVNAGRAFECIDFEPRIVGDGRQAGHLRGVPGFQNGVLDERQPGSSTLTDVNCDCGRTSNAGGGNSSRSSFNLPALPVAITRRMRPQSALSASSWRASS